MKVTVDFNDKSIQKYLDEHLKEILTNEIARISKSDLRKVIMDSVQRHAEEEVIKCMIPSVVTQAIETEVRRQARKIICKVAGDA